MKKEIKYNRFTKDFDAYLDGEFIGSYSSAWTAENELDRLALYQAKNAARIEALEELKRAA